METLEGWYAIAAYIAVHLDLPMRTATMETNGFGFGFAFPCLCPDSGKPGLG
jgi:hypothetical protein